MVVAAAGWSMALAVMTAMAVRMTAAMLRAGRMVTSFLERTLLVVLAVWAGPVTVRHQGSVLLMAEWTRLGCIAICRHIVDIKKNQTHLVSKRVNR
jgi:hypothetical protein